MTRSPRRVRIDLSYDGTAFAGWQFQPGQRTVQGTVEAVLTRLQGGRLARVRGAGRTDAGAHARMQCADGLFDGREDDAALLASLRGMLPEDVRAISVRTVGDRFHSQKSARRRTYRYQLDRTPHGDPFRRRFALHRYGLLDRDRLGEALSKLHGFHDWSGFAGAGGVQNRDPHRTLFEASYDEAVPGTGWFVFQGDGFLNYMVRNIVGTLLEIASGDGGPERIDAILDSGDRGLAGATAAAQGLVLWHIDYPDDAETA